MSIAARVGHVILSHGMESGPNATKVTRLAAVAESLGLSSERVDDQGIVDPLARLDRLLPKIDQAPRPLVLVGSSLGAYVSGLASMQRPIDGLFLLAPPVRLPGISPDLSLHARHIEIVHGWRDELIPPGEVVALAQATRAMLKLYDSDHRLTDVVPDIEREFAAFLARLLGADA
ncbi:MAG TPA: alpha/beta fold hydrolase [Xanthomonadales bacterium]|nr:alpha/beta fold hydrolase [Xanthomonadales bacterium]